jgi:hypothetical protein
VIGILRKIAFRELVWARLFCLRWIAADCVRIADALCGSVVRPGAELELGRMDGILRDLVWLGGRNWKEGRKPDCRGSPPLP